jgi:LytS/YehU family sensor histidine kinase
MMPPGIAPPPQYPGPPRQGFFFLYGSLQRIIQVLFVLFLSLIIKINNQWKQTQKEKLSAELSYLKAQINPHFLFNTLNTIYSLSIQQSPETPKAVIELSEMMRYVTTEAHQDFVSLEKEIKYLDNYIALQKLRLESTVELLYTVKGETAGKKISPLLLMPFIENAFKHGVNPEEESMIRIDIEMTENQLHLFVFNQKVTRTIEPREESGIGILNAKNRLELMYPGQYDLQIKDASKDYSVSLFIREL